MTKKDYWLWLSGVKDMHRKKMQRLINHFQSPAAVYHAGESKLKEVTGIREKDIINILNYRKCFNPEQEWENLAKKKIKFVSIEDVNYPERLKSIYDKPFFLYYIGNLPDDKIPTVAIIGARECTHYGKEMAGKIASELSDYEVQIISGMARGIDSYGQWGAVRSSGRTFAVLGCGPDICYPSENSVLYHHITESGGLLSEYPPGSPPLAWQFPFRNRIISGLSDAVIVIEAREKSGSLITVDCALEQGKDIYAVPGRLTDSLSSGCNKLIRMGAGIFSETDEIIRDLGIKMKINHKNSIKTNNTLERDQEMVYSCLDFSPKNLQTIVDEVNLPANDVFHVLIQLELKDLVLETTKNYYAKKHF